MLPHIVESIRPQLSHDPRGSFIHCCCFPSRPYYRFLEGRRDLLSVPQVPAQAESFVFEMSLFLALPRCGGHGKEGGEGGKVIDFHSLLSLGLERGPQPNKQELITSRVFSMCLRVSGTGSCTDASSFWYWFLGRGVNVTLPSGRSGTLVARYLSQRLVPQPRPSPRP